MVNLVRRKMFVCFLFVLISGCVSAEQSDWDGRYVYEASYGDTFSGISAVVVYTLMLGDGRCLLSAKGYQTNEEILCRAHRSKNALTIRFASYSNGDVANIYGVQMYKVGGVLFVLAKGDSNALLTYWYDLKPDNGSVASGEFFVKSKRIGGDKVEE